jgi:hypothetical protein
MIYLLFLLTIACGNPGEIREFPDAETKAIVERFEAEIAPIGSITVEFVDSFDLTIGMCTLSDEAAPHIRLLRSFWDTASDAGKEQLLYHELTHSLGIDHDESKDYYDRPLSIMYPYHISDEVYTENRAGYINDLRRKIND